MHILDVDPDYNPRTLNPQSSGRVTRHGSDIRPDNCFTGIEPGNTGAFEAPDVSGRLIVRAANDNPMPAHSPGRSLLKRTIVGAYCYGLLSVRTTQRAIDRLRAWEA